MAIAEQVDVDGPVARISALLDPGTFRPVRSLVGDGVVAGTGRVEGKAVCVWAQDGSYRGGSLGAAGGETIARTIERASALGVPVVGFPVSGGARMQEGVASLTAYAAIFRAQAICSVPVISVVCGVCAGGAAYSPALGDLTVMVGDAARMFLTGPRVIERVTGEQVDAAELGGARVHGANGVAQLVVRDLDEAVAVTRRALGLLRGAPAPDAHASAPGDRFDPRGFAAGGDGSDPRDAAPLASRSGRFTRATVSNAPIAGDPADVLPDNERAVYDVREVIARIVDGGALLELSPKWARNLVVGLARLEGAPVGVIASQPRYLGGCLDAASSEKGAWSVELCDRFGLPLIVLADTPGFLPGVTQERAGVLRHGASLLRAFGRARVPRATVTLRQAFGGAHIVMNSRDLGATATFAWPGARIGVMGARQAVEITRRREISAGADADALAAAYAAERLPVRIAAQDGLIDEVIEPSETRDRLAEVLVRS